MNEWKKVWGEVAEGLPPGGTPGWAGWVEGDDGFTSGLFVFADDGIDILWCRCEETISSNDFGEWLSDRKYPVSHWMYLPEQPEPPELPTA